MRRRTRGGSGGRDRPRRPDRAVPVQPVPRRGAHVGGVLVRRRDAPGAGGAGPVVPHRVLRVPVLYGTVATVGGAVSWDAVLEAPAEFGTIVYRSGHPFLVAKPTV